MLQLNLELPRNPFTISVNMTVPSGSAFCLFGPSAMGKSSILSVIAGFETGYRQAYLSIDNKVLINTDAQPAIHCPPWRRKIGYMEQSARLFPHLNVKQNILYGVSRNQDQGWLNRIIEAVGLKEELSLRPDQLSGGMKQRVALARALAAKPDVLLLDEPFSALDWISRRSLQDLIRDIHREFSITLILVTHQLTEAQRITDQMALIDQGEILQTGSPSELIERPNAWKTAQLMGYTSIIRGKDHHEFFVHPDRVILGDHPDKGIPIEAVITDMTWYEGRHRVQLSPCPPWTADYNLEINLPSLEHRCIGDKLNITISHPPV